MKPDDFFEYLCLTSRDTVPLLPFPEPDPVNRTCGPCTDRKLTGPVSNGMEDISSRPFEILPEELRFLRHPHRFASPAFYESGVII